MINLSVDSADLEGTYISTTNEIESIIELVYEVILDHSGDFIPEQDEPDPETSSLIFAFEYIIPASTSQLAPFEDFRINYGNVFIPDNYTQPDFTTQSPPPDLIS